MQDPPSDDDPKRREWLDRKAANKARWRALLDAGGKVIKPHIRDKNRFISAMLNTRWIGENENSEDWELVTDRTATMLNEFADTYGDEPASPIDRQPAKRLPFSKS
jgi:hypothetical protein